MKNFDLEAAKRGAAVRTASGTPVRIICFDRRMISCPIIGLIMYGSVEKINEYSEDGSDLHDIGNNDLMMRDDDYLEKLERGEYQSGQIRPLYENPSNSMGLTKREWFAGMAIGAVTNVLIAPNDEAIARYAVLFADALIAELEKKKE